MILENYFDQQTISVHLRENSFPTAKKGIPGNWKLVKLDEKIISQEEIKELVEEIQKAVETTKKSFLEIEREGSQIIQLGEYRIVIVRPPFSDGWEITAVKPIAKLGLDNYQLDEKLKKRLVKQAEGVLISGSPGEGKTTLARALAEYYSQLGRVVKTIESPRDLLLNEQITQYSLNYGDRDEIYDVLLLSRPDNTIFDEIRNAKDFQLFSELRLAGIGMMGIIHAAKPIDAIQRFIGKIEMGVIPQIIDTVVFVSQGMIKKTLSLNMKVKVPTGMSESDLARPVVEVKDFQTGRLEFEIYTYGEQTIVLPVEKETGGLKKIISQQIKEKIKKYAPSSEVELISENKAVIYVLENIIPKILGKKGKEIEKLEKEIGLSLDVRELKREKSGKEITFDVEARRNIIFYLDQNLANKEIDIYAGENYLLTTRSSKKAIVKINPNSEIGKTVLGAVKKGVIRLLVVG